MILYLALLLILIFLYPFCGRKRILLHGKYLVVNNKIYVFIVSFILSAFLGLRGNSVGIDTNAYYSFFDNVKLSNLSDMFQSNSEYGYWLFQFIIGNVFGDFQFLLIIVGVLYVGVISYYIYNYSENPMFSYILFIVFGFYPFAMSANRQTMAIAIVMIAFKFIKERKMFKFLILISLAASFHITAVIFLPAYWLNKLKLNRKTILILVLTGFLAMVFKNLVQEIMSSYARIGYEITETGGYRLYLLMLVSVLLGVVYRKPFIAKNEINKNLFYMMAVCVIIMPVIAWNPVVLRLYLYYYIFMIIYIPNILSVIKERGIAIMLAVLYIIVGCIEFFSSTIYVSNLDKYLFFWQ